MTGNFTCTPHHAVEVAYLISTAEGCVMNDPMDAREIAEVLLDYLRGNIDTAEAIKIMLDPDA